MTRQFLKEFGIYMGFNEVSKSWYYQHNTKTYVVNSNGTEELA